MWFYIVSWCVVTVVSDPCPMRSPIDEFGRKQNVGFSCAVYHFHSEKDCGHEKTFSDRKEAISFYSQALKNVKDSFSFNYSGLSDVKIDSFYKAIIETSAINVKTSNAKPKE